MVSFLITFVSLVLLQVFVKFCLFLFIHFLLLIGFGISGVDNVIARVIEMAKQKGVVGVGDFVVVSSGMKSGPSGLSNLMKVMTVE